MTASPAALLEGGELAVDVAGEVVNSITVRAVPYGEYCNCGWFLEQVQHGAFARSVAAHPDVPLLLFHNAQSFPVGVAEAYDDNPAGLDVRFRIARTAIAQQAGIHARDGFLSGASVGFVPERSSWTYAAEFDPERGPDYMDRVTRTQARLVEVSLTPTPAFAGAQVLDVDATATRAGVRSELRRWQAYTRRQQRTLYR